MVSPALNAWRGFSFEMVVFGHVPQIKQALNIGAVQTEISPWHSDKAVDGAQVDMVIERADRVVNVCEMKFCSDDFKVDAATDRDLRHKMTVFAEETKTRYSLHLTLITTYGLSSSPYQGRFQSVITMDDLFK